MKAISFIKNNAIAMSIALAAVIGFSAFKVVDVNSQPASQSWHRVLTESNQFEWRQGPPPSPSCEDSEDICNVTLPFGQNPEEMTTQQIKDNAVNGEYELGYTIE